MQRSIETSFKELIHGHFIEIYARIKDIQVLLRRSSGEGGHFSLDIDS